MKRRPKVLDLFCGAGGASMGLHRAGFEVTGVDIRPQPRYPFRFIEADALIVSLEGYDFIWASPPCQAHTALKAMWNSRHHPDLIPVTRRRLKRSGLQYVIENVVGAPLSNPLMLCGTMFDLQTADGQAELWRHRLFESSLLLRAPRPCSHRSLAAVIGVYGGHGRDRRRVITVVGSAGGRSRRSGRQQFPTSQRREALGIEWMTNAELSQSIPPAYSEFIGRQALKALR